MKEERNLSIGSFLSLAIFAGLLVSSIGTTSFVVQKQAFGQGFIKNQPQSTPFPGMNFSKPKDVWSKNGILKTTLTADYQVGKVDNKTITAMVYNGSLPGPTLHVYPGDRLEINLINNLNEPTNVHFHGFHVSPANNSDNIFLEIAPGKTQHYSVNIPKDYPLGTTGIIHIYMALRIAKFRQVCLGCLLLKGYKSYCQSRYRISQHRTLPLEIFHLILYSKLHVI